MRETLDLTRSDAPTPHDPDPVKRTLRFTDPVLNGFARMQSVASSLLTGLNAAQKEAVTASAEGGVFVAGVPGCGKTKTLTGRVAWLIQHEKIEPSRLVVVTFTNKAANEMRERLKKMLGDETTGQLIMGTFHAICAQYLRRYGKLISLASNFSILDRDDASSIIKRVIASIPNFPSATVFNKVTPVQFLDKISSAKSKMLDPETYRLDKENNPDDTRRAWIGTLWTAYQNELKRTNAVDFDDLLIYGHQLFKGYPHVVASIQSVLVDEFQDTSVTQYEIAKYISKSSGSLTVVGDPDQAIYGWRNAEVENLQRMIKDFHPCRQIFLEENYRSPNAILGFALAVIQQDKKRPNKSLHSSHPSGAPVVLHKAQNAEVEASWIASRIVDLSNDLGGLVEYDDFAILLRAGYQSLSIELALQDLNIPSIFRGGHKFFERAEVKDILSYLQLVSNPRHSTALERVINTPKRSLAAAAQRDIYAEAESTGTTAWDVLTLVADNSKQSVHLSGAAKKGAKAFVSAVRACRNKATKVKSIADLITFIIDLIEYKDYLVKTYKDKAEDKLLNVEELKNYATIVAKEGPSSKTKTEQGREEVETLDEGGPASTSASEAPQGRTLRTRKADTATKPKTAKGKGKGKKSVTEQDEFGTDDEGSDYTPSDPTAVVNAELDAFLSAASLATDHDTQSASTDGKVPKVVISTVHSAKGLEWPVVFIPGVEDGTFPFYKAATEKEIDEERRLLYVAITRAQTHCLLSYASTRKGGGIDRIKVLSEFVSDVPWRLWSSTLAAVTEQMRGDVARVIGRPLVSDIGIGSGQGAKDDDDDEIEIIAPNASASKRPASPSTTVGSSKRIKANGEQI
ncbi:hypothetical protein JCM11491_003208 [Sporobolomyces phaffii]